MSAEPSSSNKIRQRRTVRRGQPKFGGPRKPGVAEAAEDEEFKNQPHSFVLAKGKVGRPVRTLVNDFRLIMEPYTASKLKVRRVNVLRDFVNVAGVLHVSHLVVFTKTLDKLNMRIIRVPHGPTLSFNVESYTLYRDVISSLKRYHTEQNNFQSPPLLIMNNFVDEAKAAADPKSVAHMKLTGAIFQGMFPTLNVNTVRLASVKRCLLLNYRPDDDVFDLRHYAVRAVPAGVSRSVKKLVIGNKIPDLGKFKDISDFVDHIPASESEAELDGAASEVTLPQNIGGRGNARDQTSALRLFEIGPRLTLKLVKVQEGISSGEVLYHHVIKKTPEEVEALRQQIHRRESLKAERKRIQQENVKRKLEAKNQKLEAKKAKLEAKTEGDDAAESSDDDDVAYFKAELGEAPDAEVFASKKAADVRQKDQLHQDSPVKPKGQFFRKRAKLSS